MKRFQIHKGYAARFTPRLTQKSTAQPLAFLLHGHGLIGAKLDLAQHDLGGDIKKLKGFKKKYRLRAGTYRLLFELEGARIVVYDLGDRKDIYG